MDTLSVLEKNNLENQSGLAEIVFKQPRLNALTSLRFFAALMIVIYHSLNPFGFDEHNILSNAALDQGVSCFFVLSGFILSYAYPKLDGLKNILRFFIARIGRIWPAHIVTGLIAICCLHLNIWQPIDKRFPWITLANFTMIHGWIFTERSYFSFNAPSWSISTEFFFYLCFPFLIHKFSKTWKVKIILSAFLVVCSIGIALILQTQTYHIPISLIFQRYLYINPLSRIFEFTVGMVVFLVYRKIAKEQLTSKASTTFEIFALALIIVDVILTPSLAKQCLIHPYTNAYIYWLRHCGGAVFYSMLILALAIGKGVISKILSNPIFVRLGDISYSIYLLHWIILSQFIEYKNYFPPGFLWLVYLSYFAAVLVVAYLNYALIETVFRRQIILLGEKSLCHIK